MSTEATGIESLVCQDIVARQKMGIAKYGMTVQDNPAPPKEWIRHAYEEALDLAVYLRRLMATIDEKPGQNRSAPRCVACGEPHEQLIGDPPQCPACYGSEG